MRNKFGTGAEIKHLADYLRPSESVKELAGGRFGKGNGLVVLTNERVIFVFHGLIQRSLEEFRLERLDSIAVSGGVMWASVMLTVAGNKAVIEQVDKTDAKRFVEATRAAMAGLHAPNATPHSADPQRSSLSLADELTKLAHLRDSGVLTEDEFARQKAKLLGS